MNPSRARVRVAGVAAAVVVADQLTKWAVQRRLALGEARVLLGRLRLVHTTNTGIAFSLGDDRPLLRLVLPAVVVAVLVVVVRIAGRAPWSDATMAVAALGGIAGGAVGNQLDRTFRGPDLLRGAVVDFIDIGRLPLIGPFPVFNVADAALTVSCAALAFRSMRVGRPPADSGSDGAIEAGGSSSDAARREAPDPLVGEAAR